MGLGTEYQGSKMAKICSFFWHKVQRREGECRNKREVELLFSLKVGAA